MNDQYFVIEKHYKSELTEKKSTFIAEVFAVTDKEKVTKILVQQKKKYYDSSHVCWAYITGKDYNTFHYSDDGEPNGTAGIRIFNEIKSAKLTNILITVTRYYGGIKLGVGPLGKAYSEAAKSVILNSEIIKKYITEIFNLKLTYEEYNRIKKPLSVLVLSEVSAEFNTEVNYKVEVRQSKIPEFRDFLRQYFAGRNIIEE